MPAPTALIRQPEISEEMAVEVPLQEEEEEEEEVVLDFPNALPTSIDSLNDTEMHIDTDSRPRFAPAKDAGESYRVETRKIPISPHRMSPLRASWSKIYPPLVEHLKLQVRMNVKQKAVELRTSKFTTDSSALQQGADFISAFNLGFEVSDAIALLRVSELFLESFEIKDVKASLHGSSQSRAIGRIAGKDGRVKYAIENASRTRIVLADTKIHILGAFKNIHIAREAIVSLILGSPPGKVYGNLRTVASRMKERF